MYDTIIIGAGPTGLSAAIYATRRMMKALVISKNVGGQVIWASEIENYPGIKTTKGPELIMKMQEQAESLGVQIKLSEVSKIIKSDNGFIVSAGGEDFETKTIIIAMGLVPRSLKLANEKELTGRGISYCANCDGPFFKGKTVAVIGGGNAALDAAEVMSKIASRVYLINRGSSFEGFASLLNKVKKKDNIEIIMDSQVVEIIGQQKLETIKIQNRRGQDRQGRGARDLNIDGLFVEIGHEPKTDLVADLVERDSKGQIVVDLSGQTSTPGMFAAGDVTQNEYKQIIVGCGQGAVAALAAYKYLQSKNNIIGD